MSVIILSDKHISVLTNFLNQQAFKPKCAQDLTAQQIGQTLLDENTKAYCNRYREEFTQEAFTLIQTETLTPVQAIKAAQAYEYQASESNTWEGSDAKAIIESIINAAILQLPGYEDAKWTIE